MKYEILPIIDIWDLKDAMVAHYGNDFRVCNIRQIMLIVATNMKTLWKHKVFFDFLIKKCYNIYIK